MMQVNSNLGSNQLSLLSCELLESKAMQDNLHMVPVNPASVAAVS